jgi:ribonuclease D
MLYRLDCVENQVNNDFHQFLTFPRQTPLMAAHKIHLHQNDLPAGFTLGAEIAVDTETLGLNLTRDRLCLVQLRGRDTDSHLVQIARGQKTAPHLKKLLEDKNALKIFHFARFDIAFLKQWLDIDCRPVFCTKIASKLVRTWGDRHGLKDNLKEALGVEISKTQQTSDWGADTYSPEQLEYAASDVLHLHALKDHLAKLLARENRTDLAQACFDFLPTRAALDRLGWEETDIFAHS